MVRFSVCCRVTASHFLLTSILRASNGPNLGPDCNRSVYCHQFEDPTSFTALHILFGLQVASTAFSELRERSIKHSTAFSQCLSTQSYAVWNLFMPFEIWCQHPKQDLTETTPAQERNQSDKQLLHHSASHFVKQTE